MNNSIQRFILLNLCAGAACLAVFRGHAQESRFYARADAGGILTSDTELKEFFGPVTPGTKVKFDPGVRFAFAAGYRLTDWFSAEAETGVMAQNLRSITGADRVDAAFSNVPFLVNARFQCPHPMRVAPYFGGGLGLSAAGINVDRIDIDGTSVHGNQADAVFAYQAFGGLRFALNERMGLSVEYHYFATTEPSWEARHVSGRMRFGGIDTHTVSVAFDFKF